MEEVGLPNGQFVGGFHMNFSKYSSCVHRASTVSKHLFINPTDTHNYKITGMLKQLKFPQLLGHLPVHSGTIIRELFALQPRKKHGKTSVRVAASKNTWTKISIHRQR